MRIRKRTKFDTRETSQDRVEQLQLTPQLLSDISQYFSEKTSTNLRKRKANHQSFFEKRLKFTLKKQSNQGHRHEISLDRQELADCTVCLLKRDLHQTSWDERCPNNKKQVGSFIDIGMRLFSI